MVITPIGVMPIKYARHTQYVLGLKDGNITWVKNLKWHEYEVYGALYEITAGRSSLIITHDNPILTPKGWSTPENLSSKDLILHANVHVTFGGHLFERRQLGTLGIRNSAKKLRKDENPRNSLEIFTAQNSRCRSAQSAKAQFETPDRLGRLGEGNDPGQSQKITDEKYSTPFASSQNQRRGIRHDGKAWNKIEGGRSLGGFCGKRIPSNGLGLLGGDYRWRGNDNYPFHETSQLLHDPAFIDFQLEPSLDGVDLKHPSTILCRTKENFGFWRPGRLHGLYHLLSQSEVDIEEYSSLPCSEEKTCRDCLEVYREQGPERIWRPLYSERSKLYTGNANLEYPKWKKIESTRELTETEIRRIHKVYDLTTTSGNFFANGILIHNCPLCGEKMAPYTPNLTPRTYRAEEDYDPLNLASKSEATVETLFVCLNHDPPYYSPRKPMEVMLK